MSNERDKGFDIGAVLRRARVERGLSLEEVEEATKIRTRYIEGLENEDYDALPAAVYVRGFLKTYADFLGLDDEELIRELRRQQTDAHEPYFILQTPSKEDFEEPEFRGDEFSSSPRRTASGTASGPGAFGGTALILAVAALVFIAGILYFIGRGSQSADETNPPSGNNGGQAAVAEGGAKEPAEQPSGNQPSGEESPEPPENQQPAPPEEPSPEQKPDESGGDQPPVPPAPPETLEAKVTVQGNISWLEITVDGVTELAQVGRPGFSRTFEAEQEITINTGNAGAVRVEVNGQDVGFLGESGQVTTRTFNVKNAGA